MDMGQESILLDNHCHGTQSTHRGRDAEPDRLPIVEMHLGIVRCGHGVSAFEAQKVCEATNYTLFQRGTTAHSEVMKPGHQKRAGLSLVNGLLKSIFYHIPGPP
jgi:ribosomal protein L27